MTHVQRRGNWKERNEEENRNDYQVWGYEGGVADVGGLRVRREISKGNWW